MRKKRAEARKLAQETPSRRIVRGIKHGRFGYEEKGCRCYECIFARSESDSRVYKRKILRSLLENGDIDALYERLRA